MHLTQFHLLTGDSYPNHKMDNVATDCDINQRIDKKQLPSWGIFIDELEKQYPQLDWKRLAGRHHYYHELNKLSEKEKEQLGIDEKAQHVWIITDGDGNKVDPNSLTDAEKNAIRIQVESTIENLSEEIQKSQGHIPVEIDQLIKGFVKPKPVFNYKKYIKNYIGNSTKYYIGSSKLRENQRFPGQPKIVLKPLNRILVLVDESGSVSQPELFDFLNEIHHLSKTTDIEIRPFDTVVMKPVKYSGKGDFKRTNCGGTSFTAAVSFYNNNKEYNSCIVFTDGFAETPPPCAKKLLWVISSNGNESSIANHAQWIKIPKID
jgi:predicted metal-dependent peptidase